MGFSKRDKGKNEESGENNELKPSESDETTPPEIEMEINSIRVSLRSDVNVTNETIPPNIPHQLIPSMNNEVHVLVLKERKGNRYLPIWIHPYESANISVRLQGTNMPRPQTHDFLCDIIMMLGATVENVVISELKDDCYYAKTRLNCDGQLLEIDCRPSDAVNVAVRTGVPIYTTEEVLEKASVTAI